MLGRNRNDRRVEAAAAAWASCPVDQYPSYLEAVAPQSRHWVVVETFRVPIPSHWLAEVGTFPDSARRFRERWGEVETCRGHQEARLVPVFLPEAEVRLRRDPAFPRGAVPCATPTAGAAPGEVREAGESDCRCFQLHLPPEVEVESDCRWDWEEVESSTWRSSLIMSQLISYCSNSGGGSTPNVSRGFDSER